MNKGILYALGAYLTWGLFPIYWKWLKVVPAVQLLGHRILWSLVFLLLVLSLMGKWKEFRAAARDFKVLRIYAIAAVLIGLNWLTYVWAVNAGFIVETSLGYFINPLLSVVLGLLFFGEKLRPLQWLPIGMAAFGVFYIAVSYGSLPWIALTLAFTFGFYGMVKKMAPLNSVFGMTLETGILLLPALGYLVYANASGDGAFLHLDIKIDLLLIGAGLVTTIPLLMFASAARQIPLSTIGIMQYIAPTIQFLIGILIYKENFSHTQLIGFSVVWLALIVFWAEGFMVRRKNRQRLAI